MYVQDQQAYWTINKIGLKKCIWEMLLLFFFTEVTVANASTSETPSSSKIMKVVFEKFYPSAYMENGEAKGIDVDILLLAMQQSGVKIHFAEYPWNRCVAMVDAKEVDAVIPMVYTEARASKYTLGTSMRVRGNLVVINKQRVKKEITKLQDLENLLVAVGKGYGISKEWEAMVAEGKVKVDEVFAEDVYGALVRKVAKGGVDAAIVDVQFIDNRLNKLIEEGIDTKDFVTTKVLLKKETHVGFTKDNPFAAIYENGLAKIKLQIPNIVKKYNVRWVE
ncbi:MAG: transporter substrate-binding domain-containing protein [Oligoflexia bacterium]|nr:transporter substrate-binding domain-containing protein [Oligoflexia bacterium]